MLAAILAVQVPVSDSISLFAPGEIAVCVFDAYGTLYDINSATERCRGDLGGKADAISALWRQKQLSYAWLRSLMGAYAPFWRVTGEALDFALETHGIDDPALRARLMDLYRAIDAYPEAPAALAALKEKGLQLAILSNGSPDMLAAAAASSGLGAILERSLSVDQVGIYKPDPRVYRLVTDHFAVPASRVAFISSNAWDAHAGAHFGFRSIWLNRSGQPRDRLPGAPAVERTTLADLPALFAERS